MPQSSSVISASLPSDGAPSVREQNRQRIRSAIVRAARESFVSLGIGETTMDRIAEQAGVARATVFKHYPTKNAIIASIVDQMDAGLLQQLASHAQKDLSAAERIFGFFKENGALLQSRREVIRPLLPILEQAWNELPGETRMQNLCRGFVGLAAGSEQREDAEALGEILLGTYLVIIHHWRLRDDYSIQDHLLNAVRLSWRGLPEA